MLRALLVLFCLLVPALAQDVRITEFQPTNTTGILDQDGTRQPWIEIWNPSVNTKVNLTSWRITHGASQWFFPSGFEIPPGEYVIVFAGGKNRNVITAPLHTSFTLNPAGGTTLNLLRSDSSVASTFSTYPALAANVSYGRDTTDPGQVGQFTVPTPGEANNNLGAGAAGKVLISLSSRSFTGTLAVQLTQEAPAAGAIIRYTLNGSAPNSGSTAYTPGSLIPITTSTLLRARIYETGKLPGEIETAGYLLLDASTVNFNSANPIVVVSNFGLGTFPDVDDQNAFMWVWEVGGDGRARFSNLPNLTSRVAVDRRGSSTLGNPKTNFNLEARRGRDDEDRDVSLLGMPSASDWVFHAPYSFDRSLMHNPLMYAMSNSIGRYATRNRMAEVFVETTAGALTFTATQSGDYYGVYNVLEKIRRDGDRVDVERLDTYQNDDVTKTGGYIFKVDRRDSGDSGFSAGGQTFAYYYPKETEIKTPQRDPQEQYLTNYINSFKAALDSPTFNNPTTGYAAWMDVPAAIDHHLLNVWAFNVDALRLSGYIHKERGGKLVFGPIWDFDRALSSTDGRDANPAVWRSQTGDQGTDFFNYVWWNRLFNDPDFYQAYIDRWVDLRRGAFSPTAVNALIDSLNAEISSDAVLRDNTRWGSTVDKRSWTSPFTSVFYPASQAAEVQRLKDYLQQRANFFDSQWVAPVTFNNNGGSVTPGSTITMSAAPGSTIYYTLDGTDPRPSGGGAPNSPSVRTYSGPIAINDITRIKARAYNPSWTALTGPNNPPLVSRWSGLRDVRYAIAPAATAATLAVTELNYHPTDPTAAELLVDPTFSESDFEYIELRNIGSTPIDLGGVSIDGGISFTFTNDIAVTIPPGAFVVISGNPAGTLARYGPTANLFGPFDGDISNSGEQIIVRGASGTPLVDFTYADTWHPTADGGGRTMETTNTDPALYGQFTAWRPSYRIGGTPGFEDIPPTITDPPVGVTVNPGQLIELHVEVAGLPAPTLQWRKDSVPIDGATAPTFTIASAVEDDESEYDVVVTNIAGVIASTPVAVLVNDPVVIETHPESRIVNPDSLVTFSVVATGTGPITYQWRKDLEPIDGATAAEYQLTAVEASEGSYDVVVTNIVGSLPSNPATLSVNDPVVILDSPDSQTVNPGTLVQFAVVASGTLPVTYQWRKNGDPIDGATEPQYSLIAQEGDEGDYDVVVTNIVGPVISGAGTLSVNDPVIIVDHPDDFTVNPETPVTLSVSVTGTAPITYQWRKNGDPIPGQESSSLEFASITEFDEATYDCVVSNIVNSETSALANVSVNDPIVITAQPQPRVVNPAGEASFSVSVTGTAPITYQWRRNGDPIENATAATYAIAAVGEEHLGNYDVVITNIVGSVTSDAVSLTTLDWKAAAGNYQGAIIGSDLTDPESFPYPGRVTAKLTSKGKVTGKFEHLGLSHPFSAQLDVNLRAVVSIAYKRAPLAEVRLFLNGVTNAFDVDVRDLSGGGLPDSAATLPQIPKRTNASPTPRLGRYTALLPIGTGAPEDLIAPGYLIVNVSKLGAVSWQGKLPDTAPIKGSAWLSPDDTFAFYTPLYGGKIPTAGHLAGVGEVAAAHIAGDLAWRKPPQATGAFWKSGLQALASMEGAPYRTFPGSPVLLPGNFDLALEDARDGSLVEVPINFSTKGKFSVPFPNTAKVQITLNRTTGMATGRYFDAILGATRKLHGVLLQDEGSLGGLINGAGAIGKWQVDSNP